MAHITINQYLQQITEAIENREGSFCAELLSFKHPHVANPRLQLASPEEKCQQVLEPPYDEMVAAHLRCTYAVANHDFVEAYKFQTLVVQSFLRAFQSHKEENWALPIMFVVTLDLRIFANNVRTVCNQRGRYRRWSISEGNLLLLNEALSKHETFFIRCGIFLILEKLKIITYRNLFKKVYLLLRTHQLPLDAFLVALKMMQVEDVDLDEVQCILANLIYMGHIKGYISHQHQKLVVSKQNPFPPLSSIS
ncbi:PREDICTED: PCI domain-containing protein 2 [Cyprinodon variegatus]|uniref:PCI domain-containing protein 2 n=1 Tax=Cyprinodon variegatus TaxID=28743 RepID=UPI0007427FF8|nr:PREDICTED: PCI domain-containing protein 2 [Cyprinodon variegatus]